MKSALDVQDANRPQFQMTLDVDIEKQVNDFIQELNDFNRKAMPNV